MTGKYKDYFGDDNDKSATIYYLINERGETIYWVECFKNNQLFIATTQYTNVSIAEDAAENYLLREDK